MGGQEVQGDGQCVILLKMLPPDTPASMVMVLEDDTDFEALKAKLEKQVDWLLDHPVSGNPRVQLVDGQDEEQQPPEPEPDDDVVDLTALEPEHQTHTLAVMRQNGFCGRVRTSTGPATRSSSAPARPTTPPRTQIGAARPLRCANWGGRTRYPWPPEPRGTRGQVHLFWMRQQGTNPEIVQTKRHLVVLPHAAGPPGATADLDVPHTHSSGRRLRDHDPYGLV